MNEKNEELHELYRQRNRKAHKEVNHRGNTGFLGDKNNIKS